MISQETLIVLLLTEKPLSLYAVLLYSVTVR